MLKMISLIGLLAVLGCQVSPDGYTARAVKVKCYSGSAIIYEGCSLKAESGWNYTNFNNNKIRVAGNCVIELVDGCVSLEAGK